eukprot:Nitzschia sp. Nitz4//scaffold24_size164493//148900//150134//NITZ4_002350-RA/size164493-augustus-gene-0.272-mRNA-1//-1//CDS//3329544180//9146//frame0
MKTQHSFVALSFLLVVLALVHQIHESNVAYAVRMLGITSSTSKSTRDEDSAAGGTSDGPMDSAHQKQVIGIRQVNNGAISEPPKIRVPHDDCPDLEPMTLQWHRYSEDSEEPSTTKEEESKPTPTNKTRVLVGLMSGNDDYAQMLDVTGRINKAYAKQFGFDVLVLQGIYLVASSDKCEPPKHRATFNKIGLLHEALRHKDKYDQLLLLDTDAMMYNLSYDVTSLMMTDSEGVVRNTAPQDEEVPMLVAHRVKKVDVCKTWDVNIGVTLWNLHHPRVPSVLGAWEEASKKYFNYNPKVGDQRILHSVLKGEVDNIRSLKDEFAYGHGTVVRHYIRRRTNKGYQDPNVLSSRLDLLREAADEVCHNFPEACAAIDAVSSKQ